MISYQQIEILAAPVSHNHFRLYKFQYTEVQNRLHSLPNVTHITQ